MPVSLAVWSQILKPGDGVEFVPPADLKLANAALGAEITDEKSRSSLRLIYSGPSAGDSDDDEEEEEEEDSDDERLAPVATVLCSLTPGKVEQAMLDLVLEGGQAVAFENTGKNTIYITGNFIDQIPHDDPPSDSEPGLPGDEDEEALRLEDVSSDVEVEADDEDVSMQEPEPPKAEKKKSKQKKQKGVSVSISEDAPPQSQPQKESTSESKEQKEKSKKDKKDKNAQTEQAKEKAKKPKKPKKGKKSSA